MNTNTPPPDFTTNGIHYRQESDELWAWMVDDNPNGWVTFDVHDQENALCAEIERLQDENAALNRYASALTAGLGDHEAREEGWPSDDR